jgi:predicted ribosomally synthesized peptide with SipW-like signal peptide
MRTRILVVTLALALVAGLSGGGTTAWLNAKADVPHNEFTAGTVLIEAVNTQGSQIIEDWRPGDCTEVSYNVTSTGSKCIFLRARAQWYQKWCETAMVRMYDNPTDFTYRWPHPPQYHPWFSYIIHEPTENKETFYFYAAQHYRVGEVDLWRDNTYLYIDIRLAPDFEMSQSHVNVATSLDELTSGPGNGLSFGLWPYKADHDPAADDYLYSIPWQTAWEGEDLYIGVHADVCAKEWLPWDPGDSIDVRPCDPSWQAGTDGYLYYVGDGYCLEGIASGQIVTLCLEVCLSSTNRGYQDKLFRLLLTFEAIQCSNDAAHNRGWEFTCTGEPPPPTPTGGYFTAKAQANAIFRTGIWQQQAEDLVVHTDGAQLLASIHGPGTRLHGIELENIGQQDITISQIIASWTAAERRVCGHVGTTSDSDGDQTSQEPEAGADDGTADGVAGNSTAEEPGAGADDGTLENGDNPASEEPEAGADDGTADSVAGNSTAEEPEAPADDSTTDSVAGNSTADEPGQPRILQVMMPAGCSAVLWTGAESSGTTLNIQDYILYPGERAGIDFVFDSKMEGRSFTIVFIMSDGSSLEVSVGPVQTRGSTISYDGAPLDEEAASEPETTPDHENGDDAETGGDDSSTDGVGGNSTAEEPEAPTDDSSTESVAGNSTAEEPEANEGDSTTDNGDGDPASEEPEAGEDDSTIDNDDAIPAPEEPEANEGDSATTDNADGDCTTDESKAGGDASTADAGDSDPPPAEPGAGEHDN